MCIAFVATKEQGIPTDETLAHIYKSNPDGAGYVSVYTTPDKEKKMRMEKGIMTYEDFRTKLLAAYNDMGDNDDYIVAHTRIATSGGISKEKTHPFMMPNGSFLFHNGIASGVSSFLHDKESDTEWLAKHCETLDDVIALDTTSRYIVIKPDGTYDMTNNWVTDDDGRLWTNDGYEPYLNRYHGYHGYHGFGYNRGWYGGSYYDGYDDDYYKPKISPPSIVDVTLGQIADANKDSTACADGSCTVYTPYTRRDFARYELLKGLSRHKTIRRIEHTIKHNDLEYDREANAWFSGMKKINLEIKGGNVVIKDIPTTPTPSKPPYFDKYDESNWRKIDGSDTPYTAANRIRVAMRKTINQALEDIVSDLGIDPDRLYSIDKIRVSDNMTRYYMSYSIDGMGSYLAESGYYDLPSLLVTSERIDKEIYDYNFA